MPDSPGSRPVPRARRGRTGTDGLVDRDLLAVATERAVRRDLAVERAGPQIVDQLVERLGGDAVAVAVVHLQRRCLGARRLALGVLQRDQAVVGGASRP